MITSVVRVGQIWKWSFGNIGNFYLIAGLEEARGGLAAAVRCFELSSGAIYYFPSVGRSIGQANWKLFIDV